MESRDLATEESGKFALQRSVSRKGSRRGSRKASRERASQGQNEAGSEEKRDNPHGAGEALKGIAKSQY